MPIKLVLHLQQFLGDDELQNKLIKLKRMSDGEQFEVSLDNIQEIAKAIK